VRSDQFLLDDRTETSSNLSLFPLVYIVSLMTPALLFSKVAFSLTPSKLKEMWIIPLGFVIVTVVSAAVAYGLGTVFRLKKSQRSFAMCASMFQNSNSLPIALIQSLVVEVPGLKWGNDDHKDAMLGRALAYLVVYSTLGMMVSKGGLGFCRGTLA
jgi:predicted permease